MSQPDLAKAANTTRENISHYETGRNSPNHSIAEQLDRVFNTDIFGLIVWYMEHGGELAWFQRFENFEARASGIRLYQGLVVPGALQTPEYARAVLTRARVKNIEESVERRMERQRNLLHKSEPPELQVLLDEFVLTRPFGGFDVLKDQLGYLLQVSELPNVTLQVVPTRLSDHIGVGGSFQVVSLPKAEIAYVETQNGGRLVEDPSEVHDLGVRWDQVRSRAEPVDKTRHLIATVMEKDHAVAQE